MPEPASFGTALFRVVVDRDHVAARAQPPVARAGHQDGLDRVVVFPGLQGLGDLADHVMGEGVDRLWPVEGEAADPNADCY